MSFKTPFSLFIWLISHQLAATSYQLPSKQISISHQPVEQG
jgi:hypothetical protein